MLGGKFSSLVAATLDPIKDASALRLRIVAGLMIAGHLLFFWLWSFVLPQPYESLGLRLVCVALAFLLLFLAYKLKVTDWRVQIAYSVSVFFGTAFSGAWLYFGNQGNTVWLASFCILISIYFSVTDWRLALAGVVIALTVAGTVVPQFGFGMWAQNPGELVINWPNGLVLFFAIGSMLISRIVDENWRIVRMKAQLKALGVVAHELRTPLAGLQLLGSALSEQIEEVASSKSVTPQDWERMKMLAREVVKQTDGVHAMISTQLANSNPFRPFSVRQRTAIRPEVEVAIQRFLQGHSVRPGMLLVDLTGDPVMSADGMIIRQVVINLLTNALHAVIKRHERVFTDCIQIQLRVEGSLAILKVHDEGAGIRKGDLSQIFQPFHTGDHAHGHGLGLTFVQGAVKAYNGEIHVQSELGKGSTFTITFPLLQHALPTD